MDDLFGPYQRTRARVCALLTECTSADLDRIVPACPEWTAHDLLAHLVGTPATLAAGRLPSGDVDAWLQGIVDERRGTTVDDLVAEWHAHDGAIEPMLHGMGARMFSDVAVHEHDLRGALERPDHDALEVDVIVALQLDGLVSPLEQAGLGAIAVAQDGRSWRSHEAEPGWTLLVDPWEAVRALSSRRTADELLTLPADGDAQPFLAVLDAHLPLPERTLGE